MGLKGGFAGYQFVYAGLWWGRCMLAFLIVRRLVAGSAILPFAVGALTMIHSADGATQFIGQMNQFGYIFWMLAGLYMFLVALAQVKPWPAWMALGAA